MQNYQTCHTFVVETFVEEMMGKIPKYNFYYRTLLINIHKKLYSIHDYSRCFFHMHTHNQSFAFFRNRQICK